MEKELVVLVGIQFVGKYEYMKKNYFDKPYQIISYDFIEASMRQHSMDIQNIYAIVSMIAINIMRQGLSIVVNGLNISLEALHIWKKMCFQNGYKLKLIVFDKDIKISEDKLKAIKSDNEQNLNILKQNFEMLQELKTILKMKHQKIADEIIYTNSEDKKDEVLQD
jgi:predicted kinase